MFKKLFLFVLSVALLTGCVKNSSNQTCTYDACSVKAPASEIQAVSDYLSANGITAVQHCSGVFYHIETEGTGKNPSPCLQVQVRYKGMLTNGTVFDQQTNPVIFSLSNLITAWTNILPLIKEGGKVQLYVPPTLGYGNQDIRDNSGNIVIPANSILIFDINLDAAQ